jgi:hypothetical protein
LQIFEPGPDLESDVVWMNFFHPSPTEDLAERCSKIVQRTLVDVFDVALRPGSPHRRRNRLHNQTELLLAVRSRPLSADRRFWHIAHGRPSERRALAVLLRLYSRKESLGRMPTPQMGDRRRPQGGIVVPLEPSPPAIVVAQ